MSGQAAALPRAAMNSRRLMAIPPKGSDRLSYFALLTAAQPSARGFGNGAFGLPRRQDTAGMRLEIEAPRVPVKGAQIDCPKARE
jgi:hypothetical protein